MAKSQDTQILEGNLRDFLYYLEDFLSANAEYMVQDIKIVYAQQIQKTAYGYTARGVVQIGKYTTSFKLMYDSAIDSIELSSKAFLFYLSRKEMEEFLDHERSEKEEEEE